MALEQERQTYEREDVGKFVLIKGDRVVETFDTEQDALRAGYLLFGLEAFMVQDIQPNFRILTFTRDLVSCPM